MRRGLKLWTRIKGTKRKGERKSLIRVKYMRVFASSIAGKLNYLGNIIAIRKSHLGSYTRVSRVSLFSGLT